MKLVLPPAIFAASLLVFSLVATAPVHAAPPAAPTQTKPTFDDTPGNPFHREEAARKAAALHQWRAAQKAPSTNQLNYDVLFYGLSLTVDPTTTTLSGTVDVQAAISGNPLSEVELDLDGAMTVSAARVNGTPVAFTHASGVLTVTLDQTYSNGQSFLISIDYSGHPNESLGAFGFDSHNSYPIIWSLSEPYGARTWWPCKDTPSDKANSARISLTVPDYLTAVSNGVLVNTSTASGWTTYEWHENHPIAAYLISLAIHPYVERTAYYTALDGITTMPVKAWAYSDYATSASVAVNTVADELAVFASLFGEYPFLDEKYGQAQFPWGGGMEHQTATSLCCFIDWLMAHELAHQWYGDAITCRSFSDIWLNEGFATYAEALWAESNGGFNAYHSDIMNNEYLGSGTIYVPPADLSDENRIFDSDLSYDKASWVLHMLRGMVGDTTFFQIMHQYTADPSVAYGTATTADFKAVAESVSGLDLSNFFQNWIYGEYFPTYAYSWNAVDQGGSWDLTVDLQQLQSHALYDMPVPIRVSTTAGTENFKLDNDAFSQSFHLTTSTQPLAVDLDPDNWILKTVEAKVVSPTFGQGVLVVNGVDWTSYGSIITSAYADSCFSGWMPFQFWDACTPPSGGYISELPTPLGSGPIPPSVLGQYSTVIWVGNDFNGDLAVWTDAAILSYLKQGGNVLLLSRRGQGFLTPVRAGYMGIRWAETVYNTINAATAVQPSMVSMPLLGTQDQISVFETTYDQPESETLLEDPSTFSVPRAIAVWRHPLGGGTLRHSGASFAHIAGRPYLWGHAELRTNVQAIVTGLFGDSGTPTTRPEISRPKLVLHAPVPNPFNPRVTLRYELAHSGPAKLVIYDQRGRRVRVLLDQELPAGSGSATWDGRDDAGKLAASGVYSVVLQAGGRRLAQKATLIR
jgi:aminopeptidase N